MTMQVQWEASAEQRAEAARFFAETIKLDDAYVSHGEIQSGLSLDGKTWAPDLAVRFAEDLADMDEDLQLAVMRDDAGAIVAAALVEWTFTSRVRFGTLADLAVSATHRSHGLGAQMVAWIIEQAQQRKCRWMFLESGKHNHRAHEFFGRHGFVEMSHVFVKRLG